MPAEDGQPENIAAAVTEVSERMGVLIREEIELAKAEVTQKVSSLARGTAAVAAGAVFAVFALVMVLDAIAWGLNDAIVSGAGALWIGFLIVGVALFCLAIGAFVFAWRKFTRAVPPAPTLAIDEARKIRETVAPTSGTEG